ncbi:MAG: 1,4-alpha-glucan branching protein GlgB [Desulfobulbaceae bacterium]|nr:1,4-alpha-glucan branching protein GlgB [Desulfobulbaceae bacterium]
MTGPNDFITEYDLHLLSEGTHYRCWEKLGAHIVETDKGKGTFFALWAPNARNVAVIGDFNDWDGSANPLRRINKSGYWQGFIPGVGKGALYKFDILSKLNGYQTQKTDPYGFYCEIRPATASVVWDLSGYQWHDREWLESRRHRRSHEAAVSIYEVHLGSWMRSEDGGWLNYRDIAARLAEYVCHMGFTHVELLPVNEHPFDGSWGYQAIGYFAPTSRFGTPQDFMYMVDTLHQQGIGVILDWVPAHFPRDAHGLGFFDGTHLFEHADPRQGEQMDWGTFIFNYGRLEVAEFLLSNALFWLEVYHIDGLRVDAVASMLYLDYSRREGEWIPNRFGGRENLEAIDFLKKFNELVYREHPDVITCAEESTSYPMVSRPTYLGGLGFGFKWNMGWMHDTLEYMRNDPLYRSFNHHRLTFSLQYAFHENFILPVSHDEVVHGKGSMIGKMPGDEWRKFANLRLLYGYMFTHPGKKLLFMGCEIGQWSEWDHDAGIEWPLLRYPFHQGMQRWVRDLNTFLRGEPAMYELDADPAGFSWIDCNDSRQSVFSYIRRGKDPRNTLVCIGNFTPVPRHNYRLGVPEMGYWKEVLNSDAPLYGGSGQGNFGGKEATPLSVHGENQSLNITLPPLAILVFRLKNAS